MKPFFCKTAIVLSLTFPAVANAKEYVCNVEGIAVHASYRLNNTCQVTETSNLIETDVFQTNFTQSNSATSGQITSKSVDVQNIFDKTEVATTPKPATISTADFYVSAMETQMAKTSETQVETKQYPTNTVTQVYSPVLIDQTNHSTDAPHSELTSIQTHDTQNIHTTQAAATQLPTSSPNAGQSDNIKTNIKKTTNKSVTTTTFEPLIETTPTPPNKSSNIATETVTEISAQTNPTKPTQDPHPKAYKPVAAEPISKTDKIPDAKSRKTINPAITTKPVKTSLPKTPEPTVDALFSDKDVDNDIKILLNGPIGGVTNTAEAANPRLNILLRKNIQKRQAKQNNQQYIHRKAPIRSIPATIAAPQPKPKETRKQVLQTEIRNEQTAIVRLQTQLNAAQQKGDQIKIQQLTRTINDRKANIRAIQSEMSR